MLKIATALVLLVAAGNLAFGMRYLFAKEYLGYHGTVAQVRWADIPPRLQVVILGMLKVLGSGLLGCGLALAWLALPLNRGGQYGQSCPRASRVRGPNSVCHGHPATSRAKSKDADGTGGRRTAANLGGSSAGYKCLAATSRCGLSRSST
jgi:hypothetical protein